MAETTTNEATQQAPAATPAESGEANNRPIGKRPLHQILKGLRKPIPERLLETKTIKGNKITFCPWYRVQKILNYYTGGYVTYEIKERTITQDRLMLTVRITIHATDGDYFMEGTGIEDLNIKGFGDEQSNAESMAMRRACARFGLGLDLYEKG